MSEGGWTLTAMTENDDEAPRNLPPGASNSVLERLQAEIRTLRLDLADARSWARHGYEIGQRSCTWSDEGVAPGWLTEGWPVHFPSDLVPAEAHPSSCPHFPDGHGSPSRTAWGVRLDTVTRDGDGQPTRMIVESTTLAHVAQADVDWLHSLIMNRERVLHHSMVLNSIGWAMSKALGDAPPFVSSDDLREVCDRLIARMKDAEAALVELMPYQPDVVTISTDDVTYQWGCTTGSDLPITPTSEATAREMAGRYGHGVVRRPVGPWAEAPDAEPAPVLPVIDLLAYCSLAKVPVSSKVTVPAGVAVPPIGSLLTRPCSWDSRHKHEYQVVPTPVSALQAYELVMGEDAAPVVDQ